MEIMKPIIWSYWENKNRSAKRPEYLDLCEKSVEKYCSTDFDIITLTPENTKTYLPNIRPEIEKFPCLAHKSDYIRALLLKEYGGIWLEKDTICCSNLIDVIDKLNSTDSDFIGCGRPGNKPSIGFLGGKKGCKLMAGWLEKMDELIDSGEDYKFSWTELGYRYLWPLSKDYEFYQYPFKVFIPVHPGHMKVFFEKGTLDSVDKKAASMTRILKYSAYIMLFFQLSSKFFQVKKYWRGIV